MTSSTQIEEQAARWLARRDSGDWHAADEAELATWVDESVAHRVAFLRLQEAWHQAERLRALGAGFTAQEVPERGFWREAPASSALQPPDLSGIEFSRPRPVSTRPQRTWLRTAGVLVLALAGMGGYLGWQSSGEQHASLASGIGQIQVTTLDDGSQVTLSSDSRIDVHMNRKRREIHLRQGEAIFAVSHDAGRPFVVHANKRSVTAIGTQFSVRRDAADLRVVVTEGRVRFEGEPSAGQMTPPIALLAAGSMALATDEGVRIESLTPAEAERLLDWRSGFLEFDDLPLAVAIAEFNRFNTRQLEIGDADAADLRIGGVFRWANVDGFVHVLEQGFALRAEPRGDRIVLHSR